MAALWDPEQRIKLNFAKLLTYINCEIINMYELLNVWSFVTQNRKHAFSEVKSNAIISQMKAWLCGEFGKLNQGHIAREWCWDLHQGHQVLKSMGFTTASTSPEVLHWIHWSTNPLSKHRIFKHHRGFNSVIKKRQCLNPNPCCLGMWSYLEIKVLQM